MLRLQAPLPDDYTLATDDELVERIAAAKATLGDRLVILGHHYQRDEVIRWADAVGDSFLLARFAADNHRATDIVFCGVHFMAESADVLTGRAPAGHPPRPQRRLLDGRHGQHRPGRRGLGRDRRRSPPSTGSCPITYMNSSAALKAFVGRNGGAVCTSSNARAVLEWALAKGDKVLFFPDQHLGRNTGFTMGYGEADMRVWNPHHELRRARGARRQGRDAAPLEGPLLGAPALPARARRGGPRRAPRRSRSSCTPSARTTWWSSPTGSVRPSGSRSGSRAAPAGATLAIGTEIHMVQRLAREHADKTIVSLDPLICPCSTMFRIDAPAPRVGAREPRGRERS